MADRSAIEWTDATWNPVFGCSKVSPGCANCYAETFALTRLRGRNGYTGLAWTPAHAAANVQLRPDRVDQPLRWRRPRLIFVNSLSDLFHELVPDWFIDQVFAVMMLSRRHTFQVLTKRPDRMRAYFADEPARTLAILEATRPFVGRGARWAGKGLTSWLAETGSDILLPLPHVWLGTSVENQTWADRRIPELLATPAAVRFLSCEPILGPVDLAPYLCRSCDGRRWGEDQNWSPTYPETWRGERSPGDGLTPCGACNHGGWDVDVAAPGPRVDWVIAGGESGPRHRPLDLDWARSLRDQCVEAGVPFLFKQVGGRTSKAGGRELDGLTWTEYPGSADG